jgi:hypothetical protein
MFQGLLGSENKRACVEVAVSVFNADERRLHQSFRLKAWRTRDGEQRVTADLNDGDWNAGTYATKVAHLNPANGAIYAAQGMNDKLLVYAATAAFRFAQTGEVPTPGNGRVECVEASRCGMCGTTLRNPVSIERGIGPECYGEETHTTTIRSRSKATKAEKELQASKKGKAVKSDAPCSQLTTLPGSSWEDIFKGAGA